jgi:hypothetical protein
MNIQPTPVGYFVSETVENATITCDLTKFSEKDDSLSCFAQIVILHNGRTFTLFRGKINLSSPRSRSELAKHLQNLSKGVILTEIPWNEFVTALANKTLALYYEPPQIQRIIPSSPEIEFLLNPLLVKGHPALIYAPGGAGKSFFAMFVALLLQNGLSLQFEKTNSEVNVLYMDWEMDEREASRRFAMLVSPESQQQMPFYMQCVLPLADMIDNVLQTFAANDIKLVIIDSAAPALGGDINDSAQVIRFFGAIRQMTTLDITVLVLSHVSKVHKEKEDGVLPIGSIYFENLSRLTWEMKYHVDNNTTDIALFCRKSNFGKMPNLGFRFVFESGHVYIEQLKNPENLQSSKDLTQKEAILSILWEGPMTAESIAKYTGIPKDQVWVRLSGLKREKKVRNAGHGMWEAVS